MKILWIVNTIFPYPSEKLRLKKTSFGGWLNSLAEEIAKKSEIKLAIGTVYNGKKVMEFDDGIITYYLVPGAPAIKYSKKVEEYWKEINNKFNPDIVHIHGTEYAHGLAYRNICPNAKVITSIQGLVSVYADVYYANLDYCEILENITFRDIIRNDTIFNQKRKFELRGKNEIELIKRSQAIIGRTSWDYANCKGINKNLVYYHCNESLRSSFYNINWNIEDIERHTIFCSQAGYPIKGIHYMLKALKILKERYSDVKLVVAGPNILDNSTLKRKLKLSGYAKYLNKLINKLKLMNNVCFTGILDEEQIIKKLSKSNVFVSPSAIENSSNSLGEAMIIGMPCVASNVGGTSDILKHDKEGFLFPYTEPAMLAEYISKFFDNDDLCIEFGLNAKSTALVRHNKEKNSEDILEVYKKYK